MNADRFDHDTRARRERARAMRDMWAALRERLVRPPTVRSRP